jgi:hypothetical protein
MKNDHEEEAVDDAYQHNKKKLNIAEFISIALQETAEADTSLF